MSKSAEVIDIKLVFSENQGARNSVDRIGFGGAADGLRDALKDRDV
jgi:hypothetical protein